MDRKTNFPKIILSRNESKAIGSFSLLKMNVEIYPKIVGILRKVLFWTWCIRGPISSRRHSPKRCIQIQPVIVWQLHPIVRWSACHFEIEEALRIFSNGRARGCDNFPAEVYKLLGRTSETALSNSHNDCFESRRYFEEFLTHSPCPYPLHPENLIVETSRQ